MPEPNDEPYQMTYRSITTEDDDRRQVYEADSPVEMTIVVGHEFWDTHGKFLLCVRDIVERVRLDNDGTEMSTGPKYVRVESDHPRHLEGMSDGTFVMNLEGFVHKVDAGKLVPHDANTYQPPGHRR
jgi:hypothetical protein